MGYFMVVNFGVVVSTSSLRVGAQCGLFTSYELSCSVVIGTCLSIGGHNTLRHATMGLRYFEYSMFI